MKRKLKAKEEQTKIAVASIQPIVVDVETDQEIEPKRKLGRIPKLFLEQEESSSKKCVKEAGDLPHVPIVEHDDKIWEGLHEKHQQRVYRFLFQLFSYSCFNCIYLLSGRSLMTRLLSCWDPVLKLKKSSARLCLFLPIHCF